MKNKKIWIAVVVVLVALLAIWLLRGGKKEERVRFVSEKVVRRHSD